MGKVVLIEPHKVLQQAISLSLFPEHDVQVQVDVNAASIGAFGGVDLMIIDAAALRETDKLPPELIRAIQSSTIPTLWIDENESNSPPKRETLERVAKPLEGAAFQRAVAVLLNLPRAANERKAAAAAEMKRETPADDEAASPLEPIDLTEIVEEESSPSAKRKSK